MISLKQTTKLLIRNETLSPLHWLALAVIIAIIDLLAGPTVQFPLLFLFPIGLASWYGGQVWGLSLAISLPVIRLLLWQQWTPPWSFGEAVVNAGIRMIVFGSFSLAVELAARRDVSE